MQNFRKPRKSNRKKYVAIALAVLLIALGAVFILEKRGTINLYSSNPKPSEAENDDAKTTSTSPTAQSDFTDGDDRQPGTSDSEGEGSADITDNNGNISDSTDTSDPIVSSTGEISVYSPAKNSLVKSGQEVSGTSSLGTIYYRLIDNKTGVIASGQLNVINGRFSGNLSFNTSASEGRLDIYGMKPDATEFSNIEVGLRFK